MAIAHLTTSTWSVLHLQAFKFTMVMLPAGQRPAPEPFKMKSLQITCTCCLAIGEE